MKCWVCKRQARGYGHTDGRFKPGDPRHNVLDWVFCSRRCQDAFHALYGSWRRAQEKHLDIQGFAMIDPSDVEKAAMHRCLKAFGEAASEIGFDKPLGAYSETEALSVIDAIITCWTEAMIAHHEATRSAPVRGMASASDPMATLTDDLPWEVKP